MSNAIPAKSRSIESRGKKVWVVTGASRGLGAVIAAAALERGDSVAALARTPADVEHRLGGHPNLFVGKLDVTREREAAEVVAEVMKRFGRIDILVNNAGYGIVGAVEETSDEEAKAIFETNVFGLLNVTRAVLPGLRDQRSGHIINISSLAGYKASPGFGVYGATKFAVEGLSEALAGEVKGLGIWVTTILPGYFRTDFTDQSSLKCARSFIHDYAETAGRTRQVASDVNHRQPNDPRKLAAAVLEVVDAPDPPFRLLLGHDAIARVRDKNRGVDGELERWRQLSESTAF